MLICYQAVTDRPAPSTETDDQVDSLLEKIPSTSSCHEQATEASNATNSPSVESVLSPEEIHPFLKAGKDKAQNVAE